MRAPVDLSWGFCRDQGVKMKKPTPLAERWPCVFPHSSMRSIDMWISTHWTWTNCGKVPFGDLRNQWRKQHCRTLNPYGSDDCSDDRFDCAMYYQECVKQTIKAQPRKPVAYFIKVARMSAARRADEGLTRRSLTTYSRDETNVPRQPEAPQETPGSNPGAEAESVQTGRRVRRSDSGPTGIGELLGSLDLRPHQLDRHKREKSTG